MNWEKEAGKLIVEIISGHDKKGLEKGIRLRNLGVVKVDGNLMGQFMGTCLFPADAYERSARIDLGLKRLNTQLRCCSKAYLAHRESRRCRESDIICKNWGYCMREEASRR